MLIIHCPPVYGENYPEFNDDAYFVSSFKMSKISSRILKVADKIINELESGSGCVILKNTYNGDSINRAKSVLLNVCRHIGWPVSQTPLRNLLRRLLSGRRIIKYPRRQATGQEHQCRYIPTGVI